MIPGNTSRDSRMGRADEECSVKQVTLQASRLSWAHGCHVELAQGHPIYRVGLPSVLVGRGLLSGGTLTHPELKPETAFQQREAAVCSKKPLAESECLGHLGSRRASSTRL